MSHSNSPGPHTSACIRVCLIALALSIGPAASLAQGQSNFAVVGYVYGDSSQINEYPLQYLTHACYSFLHLRGNRLSVNRSQDSTNILYLTSLKNRYPRLKILLSLGGWGGCKSCSEVFSSDSGRLEFARSALGLLRWFHADGIDLDWEYPSVEGYPGHRYAPEDRENFTLLIRELRRVLGTGYEITFAAGATSECLRQSIDWRSVVPVVDRVHLMTYDFTNGYSTVTGHHTPLYSTPQQFESSDNAVRTLDSLGIPGAKIALGVAFYARVWSAVDSVNHGLYQPGKFLRTVPYRDFVDLFGKSVTFREYWDSTAQAPFRYDSVNRVFATYDDARSIALKVDYARDHHLGGIMFWALPDDAVHDGLLGVIHRELQSNENHPEEAR